MDKRFLIVIAVLVLGFFGWLLLRPDDSTPTAQASPSSHIRGTGTITLLEYGDFQCPTCYTFKSTIDEVLAKYDGKVQFQFRHFPIPGHQHAVTAARAAEAAGKQDKFWQMYDKIYDQVGWLSWSQNANANAAQIFRGYAEEIGLDMSRYDTDVNGSEVFATINADRAAGEKLGVTGTPTFFLNDEKIDMPQNSLEAFSEVIDKLLAE